MHSEYKKEVIERILARARSGLNFVQDFLTFHKSEDAAYFRSLSIVFSYSTELLLKAYFVVLSEFKSKKELEKKLQNFGHNLVSISDEIGPKHLQRLGIRSIEKKDSNGFVGYCTNLVNGDKILVDNFTDIRYDFTNDALRTMPTDQEFRTWLDETRKFERKIRDVNIAKETKIL